MPKKDLENTYSIEQVKMQMEQYIHASAERLRARLKKAWKKQATIQNRLYDETTV